MSALTRQDVLSEQEFLKAPPSLLCCTPRTQTIYRDRRRLAFNSRYSRMIPRSFMKVGIGAPDSPSSPQRAIDELGQWFRKWRIEVNPTNQQPYNSSMVRLESTHCRQNTPNLKMLDANIPWQRNYKYLGVTLDKNLHFRDHIERVRNTALFYKARLGAVLGRKSKLSRRNKRTIYKMCIRTVMTYASPRLRSCRSESTTYTTAAANRLRPSRREGNRPVTVSCDILCRDDFLQASSIAYVTRRRHSHVPSGRTR
ncbi:RNA-directed DNA polymerase from mobile element jockey [Eumeta japonica]|uniref:RNA-directed DNA polymerase from mobile element jockey n=1 Tax=Eumeta variegata TaxID=151549 RepID=A0A4C1U1C3_EUMVA|nr:RNA-directed DNA polymerase from mobile element jockey [Eumeta japonica]